MILSPNEIAYVATQAGFTGPDLVVAVAVALAESKGDTDALGHRALTNVSPNGNMDHGLWQISSLYHGAALAAAGDWRNPYVNASMAHAVWLAAKGWTAWSTFTSGSHLPWMLYGTVASQHPFAPPITVAQVCQFQPSTPTVCGFVPQGPIALTFNGTAHSE